MFQNLLIQSLKVLIFLYLIVKFLFYFIFQRILRNKRSFLLNILFEVIVRDRYFLMSLLRKWLGFSLFVFLTQFWYFLLSAFHYFETVKRQSVTIVFLFSIILEKIKIKVSSNYPDWVAICPQLFLQFLTVSVLSLFSYSVSGKTLNHILHGLLANKRWFLLRIRQSIMSLLIFLIVLLSRDFKLILVVDVIFIIIFV